MNYYKHLVLQDEEKEIDNEKVPKDNEFTNGTKCTTNNLHTKENPTLVR